MVRKDKRKNKKEKGKKEKIPGYELPTTLSACPRWIEFITRNSFPWASCSFRHHYLLVLPNSH